MSVSQWLDRLAAAGKAQKNWEERAEKVIKRYRDERSETQTGKRFNILWSNIETLKPALYAQLPKPQVSRRYKDADPVGRQAAEVLERALAYHLDAYDFNAVCEAVRDDYLLPGRAVARVMYQPTFAEQRIPAFPVGMDEAGGPIYEGEVEEDDEGAFTLEEQVVYEEVRCEYVYWKDYRHGPGRRREEIPWEGFRSYLSRKELKDRFGAVADKVELTCKPEHMPEDKIQDNDKQAEVWEIWDKRSRKVIWISPGYKEGPLDIKDAPLNLRGFFCTPNPLITVHTNDSLIPVPEYCQYQDQADELDELTRRIATLTKALKVVGVYDGSQAALKRLLSDGYENQLIPVESWAMFAEKGGLKGVIDFLPIKEVAEVIIRLYENRAQVKQDLYEITGMADIVRGASDPNETAAAQQIKSRFASLRIRDKQRAFQGFLRDLLRLKAEVIAENFSAQTLSLMTGIEVSDEVMALLKDDVLRGFRIDIETDSTLESDEQADKQSRTEFLAAASQFLEKALPLGQAAPEMVPLLGEMMMFGVRGFRAGRQLEEAFEKSMQALAQKAAQPQQPQPDPKMVKTQAEIEKMKVDTQLDVMEFKADQQRQDAKLQIDAVKAAQPKAVNQ